MLDAEETGLDGLDRLDPRFDLALHLIAAHHGRARPVISIEGCDSLPPTAAAHRAHEAAMRFADCSASGGRGAWHGGKRCCGLPISGHRGLSTKPCRRSNRRGRLETRRRRPGRRTTGFVHDRCEGREVMTSASIPVDLHSPGQVFACLGFVEAARCLAGHGGRRL